MNELKKLIPAYLQATKVIVGFCMYAIPASALQYGGKTSPGKIDIKERKNQ